MDAYQQPPPYVRPPPPPGPPRAPPSSADPYHHYYQNIARPPVPPPSQQGGPTWYANQFQYSHAPSPPPPPQWGPPPPPPPHPSQTEHLPQPHSSSAYPPPPPPPYSAHPHPSPFNANANNSGQFPLPPPPPLPPHPQIPPYFQVNQEWSNTNWGYHQGQGSQAPSNAEDWAAKAREWAAAKAVSEDQHPQSLFTLASRPGEQNHFQEQFPQSASPHYQEIQQQSIPVSSYQQFPDPSAVQHDGSFPGGSTAGFSHQENFSASSTIHQQEVPYSYSSVAGKEESHNHTGQNDEQTSLPGSMEQQYMYGIVYPPIPSTMPSAPQHDPSMALPSVSGQTIPPFGGFPQPNFQSTVPSAGAAYGLSARPPLHPYAAFVDDSFGASSASERPKKASVPNWLKEEILKNKAALGKSSLGNPEERESLYDEIHDKSFVKADQPDSKSLDSSKSTEEEEEEQDEDCMDAARTAAVNQEIKRILTEVLLKVTDELFDEIATKVMSEDGVTLEDDRKVLLTNHNALSPPSAIQAHQNSAKTLVPDKAKESETEGVSRTSSSGSPGDVLGLANYASDDDIDGEAQNSGMMNLNNDLQQSTVKKIPEHDAAENGRLELALKDHNRIYKNEGNDLSKTSGLFPKNDEISSGHAYPSTVGSRESKADVGGGKVLDIMSGSGLNDTLGEEAEQPDKIADEKKTKINVSIVKRPDIKSDRNDQYESKKSSGKDLGKEVDKNRSRADDKLDRNRRKQDDKHIGKEKTDYGNGSRGRTKAHDVKPSEKAKEAESRKRSTSHLDVKEDKKDAEKLHRTYSKEDTDRKREREKEEDRSRHKHAGHSSRDKRRRSSPTSDESSDDSRRKSRSRRRNSSPSPVRSRRRQVSGSPHSKQSHSQRGHSPYSSLETSRGRRSRSRSPHRRHR